MGLDKDIVERVKALEGKYAAMGQDLKSYLDGLLYADNVTYWNYIHLDTLLSLQTPLTGFPDEEVFIIYHQITELYFKLCIHEIKQVSNAKKVTAALMLKHISRVNRYFDGLINSFAIMVDGMDKDQFLKFRMTLLPASGFQSAQYRMIEIHCTEVINLVDKSRRGKYSGKVTDSMIEDMFRHLYWKKGATELATGKKTLTLKQFEDKYTDKLIRMAKRYKAKNLWVKYESLPKKEQEQDDLKLAMRQLDVNININWPLVHYKSAVRYLQGDPDVIAATGGTNWQKYLPPRFQKRIFYPNLWSEKEKKEWGKSWVESVVYNHDV